MIYVISWIDGHQVCGPAVVRGMVTAMKAGYIRRNVLNNFIEQHMRTTLQYIIGLLVVAVLFSNCASLTGFQDGRTAGKDRGDLTASLNVSQSPDFNDWADQDDTVRNFIPDLFLPNIEIGGRYGIADNLDININVNTYLNLNLGAKYQFFGDRESPTALAVGLEVGTFGLVSSLWNVQVPLFFSVHPSERFSWYLSPRFIYQFSAFTGAGIGLNYFGGNTGFFFGDRHKFGLDIGYYDVGNRTVNSSIGLVQVGIGVRFSLNRD